jgi:hypothetical protein
MGEQHRPLRSLSQGKGRLGARPAAHGCCKSRRQGAVCFAQSPVGRPHPPLACPPETPWRRAVRGQLACGRPPTALVAAVPVVAAARP